MLNRFFVWLRGLKNIRQVKAILILFIGCALPLLFQNCGKSPLFSQGPGTGRNYASSPEGAPDFESTAETVVIPTESKIMCPAGQSVDSTNACSYDCGEKSTFNLLLEGLGSVDFPKMRNGEMKRIKIFLSSDRNLQSLVGAVLVGCQDSHYYYPTTEYKKEEDLTSEGGPDSFGFGYTLVLPSMTAPEFNNFLTSKVKPFAIPSYSKFLLNLFKTGDVDLGHWPSKYSFTLPNINVNSFPSSRDEFGAILEDRILHTYTKDTVRFPMCKVHRVYLSDFSMFVPYFSDGSTQNLIEGKTLAQHFRAEYRVFLIDSQSKKQIEITSYLKNGFGKMPSNDIKFDPKEFKTPGFAEKNYPGFTVASNKIWGSLLVVVTSKTYLPDGSVRQEAKQTAGIYFDNPLSGDSGLCDSASIEAMGNANFVLGGNLSSAETILGGGDDKDVLQIQVGQKGF